MSLKPELSIQIHECSGPLIRQGSIFSLKSIRFPPSQGDLEKFGPSLRDEVLERIKQDGFSFQDFYPFTEFDPSIDDLAIVVTQTCDLEKGPEEIATVKIIDKEKIVSKIASTRVPKVPFINVGLLEPFERLILNTLERHGKLQFDDFLMVVDLGDEGTQMVCCFDKIYSIDIIKDILKIFNNDHKHIFFIPFCRDDSTIELKGVDLSKLFPIRVEHHELIAQQAKYYLKDEFANSLGWRLAELYGRVGLTTYSVENMVLLESAFKSSLDIMFSTAKKASLSNFSALKFAYTTNNQKRVKDLLEKNLEG